MRKEMLKEDIIPMEQITNLLERPLANVSDYLEIEHRDITARSEFNKVMYLVYEGQLRQFKIKKGIKFPFNWYRKFTKYGEGFGRQITNILLIEVAGIGELAVDARMWGHTFNFYIYDSIDDFKADNGRVLGREYFEKRMQDIYANVCTLGGMSNKYLYRYTWDGTRAIQYSLKENISLFFTYDANEFDNQMHGWYEGYITKEECEKDNAIQVAVFAEEDEEKDNYAQIEDYIYRKFLPFMDSIDASAISEKIYYRVVQDITETADKDFNDGDIDIAIIRVLKESLGVE